MSIDILLFLIDLNSAYAQDRYNIFSRAEQAPAETVPYKPWLTEHGEACDYCNFVGSVAVRVAEQVLEPENPSSSGNKPSDSIAHTSPLTPLQKHSFFNNDAESLQEPSNDDKNEIFLQLERDIKGFIRDNDFSKVVSRILFYIYSPKSGINKTLREFNRIEITFANFVEIISAAAEKSKLKASVINKIYRHACFWPFKWDSIITDIPYTAMDGDANLPLRQGPRWKRLSECTLEDMYKLFTSIPESISDSAKMIVACSLMCAISEPKKGGGILSRTHKEPFLKYLGCLNTTVLTRLEKNGIISREDVHYMFLDDKMTFGKYQQFLGRLITSQLHIINTHTDISLIVKDIGEILEGIELLSRKLHRTIAKDAHDIKLSKILEFMNYAVQDREMKKYLKKCVLSNKDNNSGEDPIFPTIFFCADKILLDVEVIHADSTETSKFLNQLDSVRICKIFKSKLLQANKENNKLLAHFFLSLFAEDQELTKEIYRKLQKYLCIAGI